MPKIPKRLSGPVAIATGPATKYTTPAATRTVIRHIHIQNPSGAAVTATVSIGADAAGTRILDGYSIPAAAAGVTTNVIDLWGPYTLEATETIQAASGANNVLVMTIDGEENTL